MVQTFFNTNHFLITNLPVVTLTQEGTHGDVQERLVAIKRGAVISKREIVVENAGVRQTAERLFLRIYYG